MYEVLILSVLVLVICAWRYHSLQRRGLPPPIIWAYWPDPDHLNPYKRLPDEKRKWIAALRETHPQHTFTLLTDKNLYGHLPIPNELVESPIFGEHRKALLSLWALSEGGVWWDMDGPLPRDTEKQRKEYKEGAGWCGAQRGSPFVQQWRDEFSEMIRYPCVEDYVSDRIKVLDDRGSELPAHVAKEKVLQYDKYPRDRLE